MANENVRVQHNNATFLVSHHMRELLYFANDYTHDLFLRRRLDQINHSKREEWEYMWIKLNFG